MSGSSLFKRRDVAILSAAVLLAPCFWAFSPHPTAWSLVRIVLFSWVLVIVIYAFNRLTELKGQRASTVDVALLASSVVAFVPGLIWLDNTAARLAAIFVMGTGVLYSVRFRRDGQVFQLKKLYLVKPIVVAAGYSAQWIIFTGSTEHVILLLVFWHFCDAFVTTSLLDILDWKQDAADGVRTLIVVHGLQGTVRILRVVNVIGILAGVAVIAAARSPSLALFVLPRLVVVQYRLERMRAGTHSAVPAWLGTAPLRVLGLVGIAMHWVFTHGG